MAALFRREVEMRNVNSRRGGMGVHGIGFWVRFAGIHVCLSLYACVCYKYGQSNAGSFQVCTSVETSRLGMLFLLESFSLCLTKGISMDCQIAPSRTRFHSEVLASDPKHPKVMQGL